ncbi:MAG: hypothetical protein FWD47_11540 [Treponema sp.]|nr:hypothetical protein [Treponema sp.]
MMKWVSNLSLVLGVIGSVVIIINGIRDLFASKPVFTMVIVCLSIFFLLVFFVQMYKRRTKQKLDINEPSNIFEQKGFIHIFEEEDGKHSMLYEMLSNAERSVDIIVYYGDGILNVLRTRNFHEKISNGVNLRLLVANTDKDLLKETGKLEENDPILRATDTRKIIEDMKKDIMPNPNGRTGTIEWHEYNTEVRYAVIIIDGKWAWWTPYHTGIRVEQTTSFVLEKMKNGKSFIDLCVKHFEKLWRRYD